MPLTPAARRRTQILGRPLRLRATDGPEDRERYERCIMGRTVPLIAQAPNKLAQIFQTSDHLVILHEQNSDVRIIPIGNRPRLAAQIRQWQGHSRVSPCRWDGDTLIVETSNFNGQWTFQGAGENMRLVERFYLTDAGVLHYAFTLNDAQSFAGPWTVSFPMLRATGPVYENACHEGNHSMPLILGGARAQERSGTTTRPTRR